MKNSNVDLSKKVWVYQGEFPFYGYITKINNIDTDHASVELVDDFGNQLTNHVVDSPQFYLHVLYDPLSSEDMDMLKSKIHFDKLFLLDKICKLHEIYISLR